MTSIDLSGRMPGSRGSTIETVSEAARRVAALLTAVVVGLVRIVLPHLFTLAALAAFSVAAFLVSPIAGCVVVGVSFLLLEKRVQE